MNKIVAFIFMLAVLVSCTTTQQPSQYVAYFDYATIAHKYNIEFRENDNVLFDYETLGSFYIRETSSYIVTKTKSKTVSEKMYDQFNGIPEEKTVKKDFVPATAESILDTAGKIASSYGGDYVLNLTIETEDHGTSWVATGLVVKRK